MLVEELGDDFDMQEVAAAAIKLALDEEPGAPPPDDGTPAEAGMERLFLRVGRRSGVGPRDVVGAIANEAGIPAGTSAPSRSTTTSPLSRCRGPRRGRCWRRSTAPPSEDGG